jgi:hypothetical protein
MDSQETADMDSQRKAPIPPFPGGNQRLAGTLALALVAGLASSAGPVQVATPTLGDESARTLEETRLTMGKWIEIQQIIAKERKEWQQGREILLGRLELLRQEVATLEQKIQEAQSAVLEAEEKRAALEVENQELVAADAQLVASVGGLEGEVRRLYPTLPEPVRTKLEPLRQRMPEEGAATRASAAERFQNVLGILNEVNKANNEITVSYEVRTLGDGKPAEVKAFYVGLAQAYYVSAGGEAGIGRPGTDGWTWTPSPAVAGDVLMAMEILQGKQSPAFVPLPVKLQ